MGDIQGLVRGIRETLEFYKSRADRTFEEGGETRYVLRAYSADNKAEVLITFPRPYFYQSPLDAEAKYGFTGLAGNYRMLPGLPAIELQAYAEVMWHAEMKGDISAREMNDNLGRVFGALAALNPQLESLRVPDDKMALYNTLIGVASEYNPHDIQYFLDTVNSPMSSDPAYFNLWKNLGELEVTWIPGPETLVSMDRQLSAQKALAAAEVVVGAGVAVKPRENPAP
jgi:hypothetical protein